MALTDDGGRDEPHRRVRGRAEEGLEDVVGEGEGDDGVAGGHDDDQRHPQVQEGGQRPEGVVNVRVVAPTLVDHRA